MQLLSKPSSHFSFLFLSDLLPPPAKTRFSPANLAVILAGILFSAAAVIWFAIPILVKLLSSIPRSSAAPRYLFIAVNFIIFAVWKLSETRPSVNEIGSIHGESVGEKPVSVDGVYLSRSALVSKKNLDYDVVSVDFQDLGASDTDRNEIDSIHGESVVLDHYIENPISIADVSGVYLSESALISKKNLDYEVVSVDRQDLRALHSDRNEIASIHGESVVLEHYIEKPISIADSSSSSFSSVIQSALLPKKNSDYDDVLHHSQDLRALHSDRNEIASIHGESVVLDHYTEKPMSIAASFLSSFSSVLSVLQSALLPKKSSDHEVVHHRRQDPPSFRNEIASIHEEIATLDHYIEKPISIDACSSSSVSSIVYLPQPSLLPKENSDHEVVSLDRQDLRSSHTDRNEIASIHEEIANSEHYIEPALEVIKPISISASSSSLILKKTLDHEVVHLHCQDLGGFSHTGRNEIALIHEQNVTLDHYYIEKPTTTVAATSTSSFTSALRVQNGEMEEENSLEATWNSIMRKTAGTKTGGGVSAGMRREGNARSEGDDDEINRRFEEFIKKSYDQIRLRKPGEMN